MSDPQDPRLRDLLDDAVSDVDPRDRLDAIQSRTKVTTMSSSPSLAHRHRRLRRRSRRCRRRHHRDLAERHLPVRGLRTRRVVGRGPSTPAPTSPSSPTDSDSAVPATLVAAYYLGDTPQGVRLYREFREVTGPSTDELSDALAALTSTPTDPDYRTAWPEGAFTGATFADGVITVTLSDTSLRDRPASMDEETAGMAVQQVVYTVQAAVQERAPVQFRSPDNPIDMVYGVPTAEPIVNDKPLDVLSLVNFSDPAEGARVTGTLNVSGVADSFEANVPWQILQGSEVVLDGFVMAMAPTAPSCGRSPT